MAQVIPVQIWLSLDFKVNSLTLLSGLWFKRFCFAGKWWAEVPLTETQLGLRMLLCYQASRSCICLPARQTIAPAMLWSKKHSVPKKGTTRLVNPIINHPKNHYRWAGDYHPPQVYGSQGVPHPWQSSFQMDQECLWWPRDGSSLLRPRDGSGRGVVPAGGSHYWIDLRLISIWMINMKNW